MTDELLKTRPCRCCAGSGNEMDDAAVGDEMRGLRLRSRLSLSKLAKRLALSASYLCELEYGRRRWNQSLLERYRKACQ
jgi:hypothetical protein